MSSRFQMMSRMIAEIVREPVERRVQAIVRMFMDVAARFIAAKVI